MTPKATFRPHERLRDPADFRRVFAQRRSESDSVLLVYGLENGRDYARLGISVSRKKVRNATERNRLKRLVREAFRLSKLDLPVGIDLVVVPRLPHADMPTVRRSLTILARALARRLRSRPSRKPQPGQ
jgi:ribonuclease P protein component